MRALGLFVVAILATLIVAALLAYPLWTVLHGYFPAWPFHKIAERLWQLLMLASLALLVRHLNLRSRADWGYGAGRTEFLRQAGLGALAGVLSMLPVSAALVLLGVRPLADGLTLARLLALTASGVGSGLAVAIVEETFFRGLMQGAAAAEGRARGQPLFLAIGGVAILYAALHFPARETVPAAEVDASSAWHMLAAVGGKLLHFSAIADAFFALTAVGVLLGIIRNFTGNIAVALGLHAGWVAVMRITVGITRVDPAAAFGSLISGSDGFTGWLVFAWTVAVTALLLLLFRQPSARAFLTRFRSA